MSDHSGQSAESPAVVKAESGLPRFALVVLAGVLLLLIGVRLSSHANPAVAADVVSQVGDYTVLTLGADNDDIMLVLDGRSETLTAYRVKNKSTLELIENYQMKTIINECRRLGAGK